MTQEEIIATEEYAAKETSQDCTALGIEEFDDKGFRTPMAYRIYDEYYRKQLFPTVDYTIKHVGGISVNTVNSKLGDTRSDE